MEKVSGTLNGTGAAINVCLGFIPDFVKIWNLERTNPAVLDWNKNMRSAAQVGGIVTASDATQNVYTRLTEGAGVQPYAGGDLLAAASTVSLLKTEDVLKQGNLARKGETIAASVTQWTSDTPGSRTGSVNIGVNTTYVGVGSVIRVSDPITKKVYESIIMVCTNDGDAADEIETATLIPSGNVEYIGPMYGYIGGAAGQVTRAGFAIKTTGDINSSGEMLAFEAGTYLS